MTPDCLLERALKSSDVEHAGQPQTDVHLERSGWRSTQAVPPIAKEPRLLIERQRQIAVRVNSLHRQLVYTSSFSQRRFEGLSKTRNRRLLEQSAQRRLDVKCFLNEGDQFHRQQRVSAQRKEVVVDSEAFYPENFGPDREQRVFDRRTRRSVIGV